jgi:hypothetical protein
VSSPTEGERAFAARHRIDPAAVARARDVLNIIVALPWPRAEQIALVARLARAARADVGEVYAGLALNRAPVAEFHTLIDAKGLADKRVLGLVRALADVDVTAFSPEAAALRDASNRVAALTSENRELRAEVDRLRVAQGQTPPPAASSTVVTLQNVASSASEQIVAADRSLQAAPRGLRLGAVELRVQGTASAVGSDLALDIATPAGGSGVGLRFVPGGAAAPSDASATMIDVRGYGPVLARRKLTTQGFAVALARNATSAQVRGVVTEQSPAPGLVVPAGTLVRLVVS